MFSSQIQRVPSSNKDRALADYIYYNADIVNNNTSSTLNGVAQLDPQLRFNETRDTAIINDASQYYFSIIRFTMDGANTDLPILIPNIFEGTGQTNVNLTTYSMAVGVQVNLIGGPGGVTPFTLYGLPVPRYLQFESESQNYNVSPLPRSLASNGFLGQYVNTIAYQPEQIVSLVAANPKYNSWLGDTPFYSPVTPNVWSNQSYYVAASSVMYNGLLFYTPTALPVNSPPPPNAPWVLGTPVNGDPLYQSPATSPFWQVVDNAQGQSQDISSDYYYVNTFQHMVDIWNLTMYNPADAGLAPGALGTCCYMDTYNALYTAFVANANTAGYTFPWATLGDFVAYVYPPQMRFEAPTFKFTIQVDSDGFGQLITPFTPVAAALPIIGQPSAPVMRLFFNTNMSGLFGNYDNTYWNDPGVVTPSPYPGQNVPDGYSIEILVPNRLYQNIVDYTIAPIMNYCTTDQKKIYWLVEQDYSSVDSFWSPISSIVFTSTLLPIKAEQTGQPVILGQGNLGFSQATSQSAFQPIITDISVDTSALGGCSLYRNFIYYAPQAEYRLSDFTNSKQDIRNIDIQVFWKNRLNNQLYPILMPNLSSVSIKIMFRNKNAAPIPKEQA